MIVEAEMSHVEDEAEVMLGGGLQRSRTHQLLTDGGQEGPASRRVPVNTTETLKGQCYKIFRFRFYS
jgi:hypothetical protein